MIDEYYYCPIDGSELNGKANNKKGQRNLICKHCRREFYTTEAIIGTNPPKITKKMLRYQAALKAQQ